MEILISDAIIVEQGSCLYIQFLRKRIGLDIQIEALYEIRCAARPSGYIDVHHFDNRFYCRVKRLHPFFLQRILKISHQRVSVFGKIYLLFGLIASDDIQYSDIKNLHGVLHKALKQAMRLGYIKANPTDSCELPRIEKKEVSYLEEDEVKSLLEAIKGHKYESIYKVDLFTGMRQGEILGLTWDCIDFNSGIITIEKQLQREKQKGGRHLLVNNKNDRVRRIKPAEFVMDILKQQRQKQLEDRLRAGEMWSNEWNLVFTNEAGGHLYAITVYKNFKAIVKSIGIPDTRFHDMRHTYAMLSIQNGDDLKTVQENVGHATASFTLDVYGHVSKRMKQDSADRMQDYFNSITSA